MSSGGGAPAEQKATQVTELPEWAKGYAKDILARTDELTRQEYTPYEGERIAGFTPMQEQAQKAAGAMQVAPQVGAATGIAGAGAIQALGAGQRSMAAGDIYQQMATDPGSMQAYMSPYMQNVVGIQQREAQRQADIARTGRGAQAVRAGAFGGSRQAIMEAEAQRNLAQQLGDIQARGSQAAFEQARQAQQFGAELGLRGLGQAGQMAGTLGQLGQTLGGLGQTQFAQQQGIIGLQRDVGKEQQALRQAGYDIGYQDFLRQQQYPYQQYGFMADMIRGVPVGQTATTIYQQPAASPLSQLLGAGTAAYGAYRQFGAAEGGSVPGYAEGGGISGLNPIEREAALDNMGDRQMQGLMGLADVSQLAKLQVAEKLQQNAQLRKAVQMAQAGEQPQTTVAEEALMEMGLGGLDVPDDMVSAAEGGIISFRAAGAVPAPRDIPGAAPLGGQFVNNPGIQNEIARLRASLEFAETDEERAQILAQIAQKEKTAPGIAMMPPADLDPNARTPAAAQPTAATGIAGLPGMQKQFMGMLSTPEIDAAKKQYGKQMEAISADELAAAKEERALIEKQQAELGERGVEREKYLKEQQEGLKGKEDKEFNMALIEAGLAMMAGTSANPFENIGKGALAGTKAYRVGMEKIADRRDKLNDALFNLYDLRYGDKMANQKELRAAEAKVRSAKTGMKKTAAQVTKELNIDIPNAALTKSLEMASDQLAAQIKAGATRAARDPVDVQMEKYFALKAEGKDDEAAALMKNIETAQRGKYAGYQPAAVRADVAVETAIQKDPEVVAAAEALSLATSSNDADAASKALTALREAQKKARAKFGASTNAPTGGGTSNQQVYDYSKLNVAP